MRTALASLVSTFGQGSKPIPGDGFNPTSRFMDSWRAGIPATLGSVREAKPATRRPGHPATPKVRSPGRKHGIHRTRSR